MQCPPPYVDIGDGRCWQRVAYVEDQVETYSGAGGGVDLTQTLITSGIMLSTSCDNHGLVPLVRAGDNSIVFELRGWSNYPNASSSVVSDEPLFCLCYPSSREFRQASISPSANFRAIVPLTPMSISNGIGLQNDQGVPVLVARHWSISNTRTAESLTTIDRLRRFEILMDADLLSDIRQMESLDAHFLSRKIEEKRTIPYR